MVSYSSGGDSAAVKFGLAGAPFPLEMCNNAGLPLSGGFLIGPAIRPVKSTCSALAILMMTAGITPNGVNGIALYDDGGNLIDQTADQSTAWSSAGNNGLYLKAALSLGTAHLSTSRNYFPVALSHMVTPPNVGGFFANAGFAYPRIDGNVPVITDSGHAGFPSSINMATIGLGSAGYWFAMES